MGAALAIGPAGSGWPRSVGEHPVTASGKIRKYKPREAAVDRYGLEEAAGVDTA